MEDRLIFRYHLDRANPEPGLLRKAPRLGGLPTHLVLGQRRGDAGG